MTCVAPSSFNNLALSGDEVVAMTFAPFARAICKANLGRPRMSSVQEAPAVKRTYTETPPDP